MRQDQEEVEGCCERLSVRTELWARAPVGNWLGAVTAQALVDLLHLREDVRVDAQYL